ncbi:MAG: carboxypeptidase-like regulatory domain-containing protein, partial [Bacteroidales bacterium]|nr:carboxypeptidase-like regulatory domain-containing protein [Bacteroidales bacterium]
MRTKSTFSRMIGTALAMLLILAGSLSASAQGQLKVTGKVIDELNAPMVGVSVIEKGTQNGVMTDGNGAYEITVKAGAVLEFYYIGYLTVDRNAINGTLNINMEPDNEMLEETVVVGYGVQKRSSLTGAVTQVKSEDITGRTITNPAQALQGKTSGVQVFTSSAKPGASPSIRVRGIGSNGS